MFVWFNTFLDLFRWFGWNWTLEFCIYIYINDLILTRCLTVVPQKCVSRVSNSHKKLSPGDILEGET